MTNNRVSAVSTWRFFWLMASVFVVTLGYGVALPMLLFFLEPLLADSRRFSVSWHVGTITGVYAFAMFLFAPLWGRLSDKVGRRPVILAGLGGFVVMLGTFGLSPNLWFAYLIKRWPNHFIAPPAFAAMAGGLILLPAALDFGGLLVVVGLVAAGSGLLAPIMSYRISLAAGTAQGTVLGKQAAASSLGQAIGAVIAGVWFGSMSGEPFWTTAGVLLIGAALSAAEPRFSVRPMAIHK